MIHTPTTPDEHDAAEWDVDPEVAALEIKRATAIANYLDAPTPPLRALFTAGAVQMVPATIFTPDRVASLVARDLIR
jgi:hypothetical protein